MAQNRELINEYISRLQEETPPQIVSSLSNSSASYHSIPNIASPRSESIRPPVNLLSESAEGKGNIAHVDKASNEEKEDIVQLGTLGGKNNDSSLPLNVELNVVNGKRTKIDWPKEHICHHCGMWFKDVVMFTLHMGFHGVHNDPFTCNLCGMKCKGKIDFFCHIFIHPHT